MDSISIECVLTIDKKDSIILRQKANINALDSTYLILEQDRDEYKTAYQVEKIEVIRLNEKITKKNKTFKKVSTISIIVGGFIGWISNNLVRSIKVI